MKRVLVNIVSKQTIPNYLFIKDKVLPGDNLLFITTKEMEKGYITQNIITALGYGESCVIDKIILKDEENYLQIIEDIKPDKGTKYLVNLTGGTKFVSSTVKDLFSNFDSEFYYIPYPKNIIIDYTGNQQKIKTRIKIKEYMSLCGFSMGSYLTKPLQDKEYTALFFKKFREFSSNIYEAIDKLRHYRNGGQICKREYDKNKQANIPITYLCNPINEKDIEYCINDIEEVLKNIEFPLEDQSYISTREIQYLTGGWFEEYVYNLIFDNIEVDDICLALHPKTIGSKKTPNDLDVVFTYGNKLFIIECKVGISKIGDRGAEKIFNEIVYKAAAILTDIKALSSKFYLVNCGKLGEDESQSSLRIKDMSKAMNVNYYSYKDLIDVQIILDKIKKDASVNETH